MQLKKYLSALILSLLMTSGLYPQQTLRFQRYLLDSGISDLTINDITQDKNGFLWMATRDGLSRFDGKNFHVYRRVEIAGRAMPGNLDALYCDRENRIWIGTDSGVFILDAGRAEFHRLALPDTAVFDVEEFYEDSSGVVWMAAWNQGLLAWNPLTKNIQQWRFGKNPDGIVTTILPGKAGHLWICSLSGLYEMNLKSRELRAIPFQSGLLKKSAEIRQIFSAATDSLGQVWLGSASGLAVYTPTAGEIIQPVGLNDFPILLRSMIRKVYVDREQQLWIGSQGYGLFRQTLSTGQIIRAVHQPENQLSLSDDFIQTMFQDRDRQMWIGTGSGLNQVPRLSAVFGHLRQENGFGLIDNLVHSVAVDEAGRIWVGTAQGLSIVDFSPAKARHFKQISGLPLKGINALLPLGQGEMLLGFNSGGIIRAVLKGSSDSNRLQATRLEFPFSQPGFLSGLKVTDLFRDHLGRLWIGTADSGLMVIDTAGKSITRVFPSGVLPSGTMIVQIVQSANGQVWVATMRGLYRFSGQLQLEKSYQPDEGNPGSLPFRAVEGLAFDEKQRLWVATARGVALLQPDSDKFTLFDRRDGLPDIFCKSVLVDPQGWPWFATRFGLARVIPDTARPKGFRFRSYQSTEGLPFDEILPQSAFADKQGLFYFGGLSGLLFFKPMDIPAMTVPPEVNITAVYLFDQPVSETAKARFSHAENTLRFDFAAADFSGAHKMKYNYRLSPVDREWKPAGQNRSVIFARLRPGKYSFEVQAENEDGVGSSRPAVYHFQIRAAFWQTWWFRLLFVAMLVWATGLFYRYRLRQLLAVEKLRTRIASDLHDEIGASLTKISMDAQLLQAGLQRKKVSEMLESMARKSDEVVHKLSDIVWSVDARNDTLGNLVERIRDFASGLFSEMETGLRFNQQLSNPQRVIGAELRHHVFLISKEALNNAARHAAATSVEVRIEDSGDRLLLEISDNGCGLPETQRTYGNGLRNMQMRATRINAQLRITSQPGNTRISLSIKL